MFSLRAELPLRRVAVLIAALCALAISTALVSAPAFAQGGSDSPTPYTVDLNGITLPEGAVFPDNGHVNVRTSLGNAVNLHFESKCITRTDAECAGARHAAAQFIGKSFIPWTAFGINTNTECIVWVQIHGYNEHFGEGGQTPIGAPCTIPPDQPDDEDPDCEADSTQESCETPPPPKVVIPEAPVFTDVCGTENDAVQVPSNTEDITYSVEKSGTTVTITARAREGVVINDGNASVTTRTWSHQFSDTTCPSPSPTPTPNPSSPPEPEETPDPDPQETPDVTESPTPKPDDKPVVKVLEDFKEEGAPKKSEVGTPSTIERKETDIVSIDEKQLAKTGANATTPLLLSAGVLLLLGGTFIGIRRRQASHNN